MTTSGPMAVGDGLAPCKGVDLYSKGMKQVEIAEHLGHSQGLISKDLGRIKTQVKSG